MLNNNLSDANFGENLVNNLLLTLLKKIAWVWEDEWMEVLSNTNITFANYLLN